MSKSVVVSGSICWDRILVAEGAFSDRFLPDALNRLSVSFLVPTLTQSHGGTGANIAYGVAQLGDRPMLVGAIGVESAAEWRTHWKRIGVDDRAVEVCTDLHTAVATMLTDRDNNQISGFHPGATVRGCDQDILLPVPEGTWTIVAPSDGAAMVRHVEHLAPTGRPFLMDPGQCLPMMTDDQIRRCLVGARGILVNEYELDLLTRALRRDLASLVAEFVARDGAVWVTRGKAGCDVHTARGTTHVPAAPARAVVDPTGCGDALRAGVLYGLARGWSFEAATCMGSALASIQVAHSGAQAYTTNAAEVHALAATLGVPVPPLSEAKETTGTERRRVVC